MKISEVKELLNQDNISEEILNELKKDETSGVQKLLISYAKKQEKKLFYKKEYEKNHFTKINVIIMDVSIFAE